MKQFVALGVLVLALIGPATPAAGRAPNIVVILADDLGVNDLSCYGRTDQPTPHLDRLAAQGMRFTSAYCAQPICSPSRAALLTGQAPARLRLTTYLPGRADAASHKLLHPAMNQALPADAVTIAEALKPAGYVSALIGKWHLGNGKGNGPAAQGFDVADGVPANTKPSTDEGGKGEYGLTDRAGRFIEKNKDRPFFLLLAHNNPHIPLAAKPELIEKHADAFNPLYAAVIETLDDAVGRVMAKLDALGLADDTLVIFTSDNGGLHVPEGGAAPATHNAPFRAGKGFVYEGGLRVPLIVRWPGRVKAGATSDVPVINADWMPTWLELVGANAAAAADARSTDPKAAAPRAAPVSPPSVTTPAGANGAAPAADGAAPPVNGAAPAVNGAAFAAAGPAPLDGVSLVPLLTGAGDLASRPLFWHFPHYTNQGSRPAGAMRDGRWKLVVHYEDGRAELFDLTADVGETTDLAAREPTRVAEMRGKLVAWRRSVGAQENAPNPDFRPDLWERLYVKTDVSKLAAAPNAADAGAPLRDWRRLMGRVTAQARPNPGAKAPRAEPLRPGAAGLIVLPASAARVHGEKLRYEPEPHKDTLGYWAVPADWADWNFDVTHPGTYAVEILQGAGTGCGGADVDIVVGDQTVAFTTLDTGHFQNFVPRTIGTVKLTAGPHTLAVKPRNKKGAAVMDLRRVTLIRADRE